MHLPNLPPCQAHCERCWVHLFIFLSLHKSIFSVGIISSNKWNLYFYSSKHELFKWFCKRRICTKDNKIMTTNYINFFKISSYIFSLKLKHLQYVSILVMCILLGIFFSQLQTSFENSTLFFFLKIRNGSKMREEKICLSNHNILEKKTQLL